MALRHETLNEMYALESPECCFVETGTGPTASATLMAIDVGFKKIRTIEFQPTLYSENVTRFKDMPNVTVYSGNSAKELYNMCHDIQTDIFFWLDAHYSGGRTGRAEKICPLIEELEHIKNLSSNTHTICIDDVRDMYNGYMQVSVEEIKAKLLEINPDYDIRFVRGTEDEPEWAFRGNEVMIATIRDYSSVGDCVKST